jgi:outer membrane protein
MRRFRCCRGSKVVSLAFQESIGIRLIKALIALISFSPLLASAAELVVTLKNAPADGRLVFQVYDSPDAFGDFRDPKKEIVLPATGDGDYRIDNVPVGKIAILIYYDENQNARIDKNFIGIPRERLAMSNNYRPKGPPSFERASFEIGDGEALVLDLELYQVLGKRGRLGVGAGIVAQSSPYVDATQGVYQPIPAITYVGERLQWFGPTLRYGIVGSGKLRLALAADYRIAAYEEDDSEILRGLGDRKGTLMAGLGLQYEIGSGFEIELGYQHDVLDRIGGGSANARLSRGFALGIVRLVPRLSFNWLSSELANHDFGVPDSAATPNRPTYRLSSTTSFAAGLGTFVELSEDWRIIFNIAAERLHSDITASPIVEDDVIFRGFATVTYVF